MNKGHYVTRAKNVKKVYSSCKYDSDKGTIYFGSRTSKVFIRIYDKALEQGLDDVEWTRVELELKDKEYNKLTISEFLKDKMVIQKILLDNLIFINEKGEGKRMDRVKPNKKYLELINTKDTLLFL